LFWGPFAVLFAAFIWQALVYRRLRHATGLKCFAYGQWLFAVAAVTVVMAVGAGVSLANVVNRSWQWGTVSTLVEVYLALTVAGIISVVALWTAGQWHRLFSEWDDWYAVAYGTEDASATRNCRWCQVHFAGSVPADAKVSRSCSAGPRWLGLVAGAILLFGPLLLVLMHAVLGQGLAGQADPSLLFFQPLAWALVLGFAGCGAVLLAGALIYGTHGTCKLE
jgi:hypothetical protein